jgi:uncharacterized repeat protein (TIGR02543 family)
MNRKALYAAAALLPLFSACDLLGPESGVDFGPEGKAAVRVAIAASGALARTVLPAVDLGDVTDWELWGGEPEGAQTQITKLSGTSETVYLETGVWDFTVKGANKDGALILQGTLPNQTISLEGAITLNFKVAPVFEGTGSVRITIKLPEGHGITKAEVWKDDSLIIDELEPDKDNTVVVAGDYSAGDYYFSVRLFKGDELYGVVSETAQVRANLLSATEYTLGPEDLNLSYLITFNNLKGGTFKGDPPDSYRSTDADLVLPEPTRDGYTFVEWHGNEQLNDTPVTKIDQGEAGDKTFYAEWKIIEYTITYYLYDGNNHGDNPAKYTVVTPTFTLKDPTHDYYRFEGWYDDSEFHTSANTTITTGSTGERTFHAQWKKLHLVTFYPNGGSPAPAAQSILEGEYAVPPSITKALEAVGLYTGQTFDGWYVGSTGGVEWNFATAVTGPLNLYAKWTDPGAPIDIDSQTGNNIVTKALNYIKNDNSGATNYTIVLDGTVSMGGITIASSSINKANAIVTLVGKNPTTISLSSNGSLFRITAGELVLGNNITLIGNNPNNNSLVDVRNSTATLTMKEGATIKDNKTASGDGPGVYIIYGGTFNMEGGTISGNSTGGSYGGGGVYVSGSTFNMSGGTISGNFAGGGGGVYYSGNTFNMSGGTISGNSANYGGGVYVNNNRIFNKTGDSVIYGDTDNTHEEGSTENTAMYAASTSGHAVFYNKSPYYYRDSTLLSGVDISTTDTVTNWNQ